MGFAARISDLSTRTARVGADDKKLSKSTDEQVSPANISATSRGVRSHEKGELAEGLIVSRTTNLARRGCGSTTDEAQASKSDFSPTWTLKTSEAKMGIFGRSRACSDGACGKCTSKGEEKDFFQRAHR